MSDAKQVVITKVQHGFTRNQTGKEDTSENNVTILKECNILNWPQSRQSE